MRWWRRRTEARAGGVATPDLVPSPRVERALVALVVHAQQIDDRLGRLERRLDATVEAQIDAPTHDDVLAVRLHSARVAAELARVTVELRAELDHTVTSLEARLQEQAPSPRDRRIAALAETIVDLTDRLDTLPADCADLPDAASA